jgi:hypothetical protein
MRHARLTSPLPIGLLALAVISPAYRRCLVSTARCPQLLLPHSLPASVAAIALAAIATGTDTEERVACWIKAPPYPQAFDTLICCRHLNRIMPSDDRTDDCAFGAMMSLCRREVQKTTFSDDR